MTHSVPPQPAIGVGAVVFDDAGRVLLVRRGKPPRQGFWSLPGGRLEPGETLADCCRREVLEETGIEIEPAEIIAVAERMIEGFHYVIIDFAARPGPGPAADPRPATDACDARWVAMADLGGYALVESLTELIPAARAGFDAGRALGLAATIGGGRHIFLAQAADLE